ncbi:hypothetical protein KEM48_012208 [Puccinia striiformis f. sp. tritici PST-130]|nr:hypothetical protein KEM48_012208 [Puccinia striiformis f. sp. tritici PST-130]
MTSRPNKRTELNLFDRITLPPSGKTTIVFSQLELFSLNQHLNSNRLNRYPYLVLSRSQSTFLFS